MTLEECIDSVITYLKLRSSKIDLGIINMKDNITIMFPHDKNNDSTTYSIRKQDVDGRYQVLSYNSDACGTKSNLMRIDDIYKFFIDQVDFMESYEVFELGKYKFYVENSKYEEIRSNVDKIITLVKLLNYKVEYGETKWEWKAKNEYSHSFYLEIDTNKCTLLRVHLLVDRECILYGVKTLYLKSFKGSREENEWTEPKENMNDIVNEFRFIENLIISYGH